MWPEAQRRRKQFSLSVTPGISYFLVNRTSAVMWIALGLIYFLHIHNPCESPPSSHSSTSGTVQLHRIQQGARHDHLIPSSWYSESLNYGHAPVWFMNQQLQDGPEHYHRFHPHKLESQQIPMGFLSIVVWKLSSRGHPWITALSSIQVRCLA